MGTLVCKAAKPMGEHSTKEVTPSNCFNCPAGRVYREVGCDAVLPNVSFIRTQGGASMALQGLFCKIRKRSTTLEYCRTCGLPVAETTRQIVTVARGLFESQQFHSAYQDLEKARTAIRDGNLENAITRSIACLESTMRVVHEELGDELPAKRQVSDLWKSTRAILRMDEADPEGRTGEMANALAGSLSGLVTATGGLRNALGDAHGKGNEVPVVSLAVAELAINVASTLATFIVRRFVQVKEERKGG
jgi:hypothetical protein